MKELEKVCEMEKRAYKEYTDRASVTDGDGDIQLERLYYRWMGILEVKKELLRMQ